ncbi:helix-turn-helix transcriptional regulator [Pseudomonas knackmussii]|uniref:helix-turn-helix transcriptional regulator n=1 Tax=Pseudomonas knackmussii TaxID=65741 RepID=UPI003BCE0108
MKTLSLEERQNILDDIKAQSAMGKESLGTSLRRIRLEITGLDQATFAKMCKMTVRTLSSLENDKGNPTVNTLNSILRPFGMGMTLGSIYRDENDHKLGNEPATPQKRGANLKRLASRKADA